MAPEDAGPLRGRHWVRTLLAALALTLLTAGISASAAAVEPSYDLFLRSDYGRARLWLNTATGDFKWEDEAAHLVLVGRGHLAFPNLGPVVFYFSGQLDGYDWVSISLKIYGTMATGFLSAFPEGERVYKVTSNFYDRDTRDDAPPEPPRPKPRKKRTPTVRGINPTTSEVPLPP